MDAVPTYALYGESTDTVLDLWLHCESIPARSALFNWEIGLHRHLSFFQILHMRGGSGEYRTETGTRALGAGVLLCVPPRAVHGFHFSSTVEGHVVTVRVERIDEILRGSPGVRSFFDVPRMLDLSGSGAAAARLSSHIDSIVVESAASREGRWTLLEANLAILLVEMARAQDSVDGALAPARTMHAGQFQALVDAHFRNQRAVGFYAEKLGLSETHLNRIARAAFSLSALGVINQRLMIEAARDLTFTAFSVKQIAYSLGFEDPAYFTRFFTKQMGISPTAFRAAEARRAGGALE